MEKNHMQVIEDQIQRLLLATQREGAENLYHAMRDKGFFDGGTAWFSMEVVLRMVKQNRHTLPIDSMIIVSLLHELHRIDSEDDSTLPGSRALAMLSQICPQFKLKQSEYEAILWYSYTPQDLKRMGEQAQAAVDNPLRQALRSAKLYCIKNPKDWEELEAAMAGKRPPRKIVMVSGNSHKSAYRPKGEDSYDAQEKTIRVHKEKVPSPDSNAYSLSNLSIADLAMELQRRAKEENLTNEEIKYIREIQDALPIVHYNIYQTDDEAIMNEMDALIERACNKRRNGVIDIVALIYDNKYKEVFDTNLSYMAIYKALEEKSGPLNFKVDTFQHKCSYYLGTKFRQNKTY